MKCKEGGLWRHSLSPGTVCRPATNCAGKFFSRHSLSSPHRRQIVTHLSAHFVALHTLSPRTAKKERWTCRHTLSPGETENNCVWKHVFCLKPFLNHGFRTKMDWKRGFQKKNFLDQKTEDRNTRKKKRRIMLENGLKTVLDQKW